MEEIENKKNKYIYVRYNGIINKYIDDGKYYIQAKTGTSYKKQDNLFLGKMSENIIELVELGDYVNGHRVVEIIKETHEIEIESDHIIHYGVKSEDIKTILTKEQYELNCCRLEEI